MKFLKNQQPMHPPATFQVENNIHSTKNIVDENRSTIFRRKKTICHKRGVQSHTHCKTVHSNNSKTSRQKHRHSPFKY